MRGILFKKDDRWVVTEIIYELGDEIGTRSSIPVHPEHDESLLKSLDGEDVEFDIVNYHGTGLISKGWDGYAKILGMYQQEPLLTDEEIAEFKADIKEAMKKSVSDEDIEKMADEMQSLIKSSNRTDAFILGAKCMRDKILNK